MRWIARVFVYLLCALNCVVHSCTREELVMIQILSRHGSQAPEEMYPNDPNPPSVWREGPGELTMFGKFQQYALGALLRSFYGDFITSDPTEVEVWSTENSACEKSALSMSASLYAPTSLWEVVRGLPWQPITVREMPEYSDRYFGRAECAEADEEYKKVLSSSEAQEFLNNYKEMFNYLTIHSGWDINNWDSAARLFDVLEIENEYNLTVPMWAKLYWEELRYLSDTASYWNLKTDKLKKLRGGPLIQLIVEKMKRKSSSAKEEKKVSVYCTHASNIAAFLSGLNLFNNQKPPFSATVAVELYEHQHEFYARFLYLNSTSPEREPQVIHVLYLDGCSEFCPLDFIVDLTKDIVSENWVEECDLKELKANMLNFSK